MKQSCLQANSFTSRYAHARNKWYVYMYRSAIGIAFANAYMLLSIRVLDLKVSHIQKTYILIHMYVGVISQKAVGFTSYCYGSIRHMKR